MNNTKEHWGMTDRLICGLLYGLLGLVFGWCLAWFATMHVHSTVSSGRIVLTSGFIFLVVGFISPNFVSYVFDRVILRIWRWF